MSISQLFAAPARARRWLGTWAARRRHRGSLVALDDHLLDDIGLSRADALREANKPFWRA